MGPFTVRQPGGLDATGDEFSTMPIVHYYSVESYLQVVEVRQERSGLDESIRGKALFRCTGII